MGCSGSKTEPTSPRRRPQEGDGNGNSGGRRGGGRGRNNKVNNNDDNVNNENINRGPIYEKTYKKRIRENLRHAAAGEDIEALEKCMEKFVSNRMENGGDLTDAQNRLDFLTTRKYIRDACMRQHPTILDKAIQRAEESPHRKSLKSYIDRAYYLKQHQEELESFRHDIMNMDQRTISELRRYHNPPKPVHSTLAAAYMCMNYPESHLTEWVDVSNLAGRIGKDSLLNEVRKADSNNLDDETVTRVKKQLNKYSLDDVRKDSNPVACFYVWDWVDIVALMGRYGKDSLIREISLADTRKIDRQTAALVRSYLNMYSFEEVRAVSNGAAVFYLWTSRMIGKYEGDKKGASNDQQQPKMLTKSGRGYTENIEQNQGSFRAKPAPTAYQNDYGQSQKQTKGQQNQAKQAQITSGKQSPKTSAKNAKQGIKTTANDTKQAAKTSAKDTKQTAQKNVKDNKANATQAKNQAANASSKTAKKADPFGTSNSSRSAW